jgi:hypothetical protein
LSKIWPVADLLGRDLWSDRTAEGRPYRKRAIGYGIRLRNCGTNVDNIRAVECHRISLELAATADELADRWDAIDMTMAGYLGNRAAAK